VTEPAALSAWSWPKRVAFRFAALYVALFTLPMLAGQIPLSSSVLEPYGAFEVALARSAGAALGLAPFGTAETSSGDRTVDWMMFAVRLLTAVIGALAWSLFARRTLEHRALARWVRLAMRLSLGLVMLGYAMAKLRYHQFPFPSDLALDRTYGESSPMGLLWTFMGYSSAYNGFTGGAELVGGTLLFFRRTTTLGALILVGVMSNVVMLNLCYDVPVKLYSMHYLVAAVALAAADARRLLNVLVLNRPALPVLPEPLSSRPFIQRGVQGAVLLLLGGGVVSAYQEYGPLPPGPPEWLRGRWAVTRFESDAGQPWTAFEVNRRARVTAGETEPRWFSVSVTDAGALALSRDGVDAGLLSYALSEDGGMRLEGAFEAAPIDVTLSKQASGSRRLVTRGFHWVSEEPFNR
jgi:hypothetical protein